MTAEALRETREATLGLGQPITAEPDIGRGVRDAPLLYGYARMSAAVNHSAMLALSRGFLCL